MDDKDSDDKKDLLNLMGLGEFSGRKNYYYELEREKIEFKRIFSEAINGILQVELSGEIIICNPALWKMCGYIDYGDLQVSCNNSVNSIFKNPNELKKIETLLESCDRIIDYETQIVNADKEAIYISLDGHIQYGRGRKFLEFFIQNIDKRKRAEDEILKSRVLINNILNASTLVSIISTDLNGTITKFNKGAEMMLGYKAGEVEGKCTPEIIHLKDEMLARGRELSIEYGESVTGFDIFIRKANIEGSENRDWTYIKKNGERIIVNLSVTAIRDDKKKLIGYLGVAKDITHEKRVQRELLDVQGMIISIIDSMPSYIIGVDSFISITHWNKQIENLTGITLAKALGSSPFELYAPLLDYEKEIIASIDNEVVFNKRSCKIVEAGEQKYKDITVYPLINEGFRGGVIRIDDVTEKVKFEELIVQSEKMMSVGGLAAGMAHEINNPLAGIIQSSQNLYRRLFSPLEKNLNTAKELGLDYSLIKEYMERRDIERMINQINQSGLRASKIVKNMLSFSRKSGDDFVYTSMTTLMDNTIALAENDFNLKKDFDFKSIEITRIYEANLKMIMCEPSKIQQVLYNLIKNGTEAMYKIKNPIFIFRIYSDEKWIIIEIEDSGHGMSDEVKKRIFEPFFTTKDVGKGTGLGMSVSYFIICDLHSGELSVESEVGHYTKFIIKLPK